MAINLRPPRQSNQIIVLENAAMRVKFHPRFKRDHKVLMPLSDEQNKVAILNVCSVSIPCHIFFYHEGARRSAKEKAFSLCSFVNFVVSKVFIVLLFYYDAKIELIDAKKE